MHLYLSYGETVIEILFPTTRTLGQASEQIFDLEQKLKRRLDVTVAYTELEANDVDYRFKNVEDAITHLEEFIAESSVLKLSAIDKLAKALDQQNVEYRRKDDVLEFNEQFANLDYFFSIRIMENGVSAYVYYDCESLGQLGSRDYSSVKDFIKDLMKLKDLDTKFKSLVEYAPFSLDRSKERMTDA